MAIKSDTKAKKYMARSIRKMAGAALTVSAAAGTLFFMAGSADAATAATPAHAASGATAYAWQWYGDYDTQSKCVSTGVVLLELHEISDYKCTRYEGAGGYKWGLYVL